MSVAIVTGANKGIGLETSRALAKSGKFKTVYLTSRNEDLGRKALNDLESDVGQNILKYHQLDISDTNSISKFSNFIQSEHQGYDVLVQNAGFAFKHAATEPFDIQAEQTLAINFWGTLNMMKTFFPMANQNARIVNVSSMVSQSSMFGFRPKFGHPIGRELHSVNIDLTLERLEALGTKFVTDCKTGQNEKEGWPMTAYGVSKLLVNGITRVYAKEARTNGRGILVNCCCPGYVKTDMSSHSENATKVTTQGAETSVWLSLLPPGLSGPQGTYVADA